MWVLYNNGLTVGTMGSENGSITKDEEHELGARITIEQEAHGVPFTITCGIYGLFAHTAYCADKDNCLKQFEDMKKDMEAILAESNNDRIMSYWINS